MTTMLERLGGHAVRGNKKNNKGDLSSIKRQNGGFGSQSTRSHPQQPAAVANYFYLSLTGPVPLRCFASLEPLLSPNSLMHACFTQISSTCSGSVNISRVAYAIHFECVTPPYGQLDSSSSIHVLNTICKQLHNRAICLVVCDHIHGDERGQLITRPFMCIDYGLMKKIMFSNQELIMC